jgi:hypothetical protein
MFIKNQSTWERYNTYEDTDNFKALLSSLKSYSKSFNSSTYTTTSTLNDVYENIKYQYNTNNDTFNNSIEEWGFSQKNVFTSDKVWKKLLNNYHVIDIATTEGIKLKDINNNDISYQIISIDNEKVVNGHRILFKDQIDKTQNGVYIYTNGLFTRDVMFDSIDDYSYFSCFIKEGVININKEFFLDRNQDGIFPNSINSEFIFAEGENYVLRNRSSYKLLADHKFTDSDYFVQKEPITLFDYTNKYIKDITSYYKVSDDFTKFEERSIISDELINSNKSGTNGYDTLNIRIENLSNIPTLLRNGNEIVQFSQFTNTPNIDIFTNLLTLDNKYNDFQILGSEYHLLEMLNSTQGFTKLVKLNSVGTLLETILLNNNSTEFIINNHIFYLTIDGIYVNINNTNYLIRSIDYANKLRVEYIDGVDGIFTISYLLEGNPQVLTISNNELLALTDWNKNEDYDVIDFSKTIISEWFISDNNLYLKDKQITNIDNYYDIPKIGETTSTYFDGIDNHIDMNKNHSTSGDYFVNNPSITTLQSGNGSFTLEFKVNPSEIIGNQTVLYIGNETTYHTTTIGTNTITTPIQPSNYIEFVVDNGNGFPQFTIKSGEKTLAFVSNNNLNVNIESHIAFVWNYTSNKAIGQLFINDLLVCSYIDQKTTSNTPIDIRNFILNKFYIGKSEIVTSTPYKGKIREIRLWNITLNVSEISNRINKTIDTTDNLVSNLIGYWKLTDTNAYIYNTAQGNNFYTNSQNLIGSGLFYGGINTEILLQNIKSPSQIQLDDNYLYILDGTNGVFTINILTSIINHNINSSIIKSIFLVKNLSKFYILENLDNTNSDIKYYNINTNTLTQIDHTDINNVIDFGILSDNDYYYLYDNGTSYNITNGHTADLYTFDDTNIENIYLINDITINKDILYVKYTDGNIVILSRNIDEPIYNKPFDFIASTTPLEIKNVVSVSYNTNNLILENNEIYFNSNIVDINNKYWNFNKKSISSLIKKDDDNAFIISTTILNEVKLFILNIRTLSITKVSNYLNETTLFISSNKIINGFIKVAKTTYYDEYLTICEGNNIRLYRLEKMNKVDYKYCVQILHIDNDTTINNIYVNSDKNIWLSLTKNNKEYISTFTNISNLYNLWNDITDYTNTTIGWLIGESGLLFKDTTATNGAFDIEWNNIIYKDDLYAIDAIKSKTLRPLGYSVEEWSGVVYMVGGLGRIINTNDNGTSWNILDSKSYNDLRGVSFYDKNNGLIVGDNNTILATFSGGSSFINVNIPSSINFCDWSDVSFYKSDKAIVIGSLGTILHLKKVGNEWITDKILNNLPLSTLQVSIIDSDLDDKIILNIYKTTEKDVYRQTLRKIQYISKNDFLIVGDNNMLAHLSLNIQPKYIVPTINVLNSDINSNWIDVQIYDDLVLNEKRAFVVNNSKIYSFEYNRFNQSNDINIENINVDLYTENINNKSIYTISLGDNSLISAGISAINSKDKIFEINDDIFSKTEHVLNTNFGNNGTNWNQISDVSKEIWTFGSNGAYTIINNNESQTLYTLINIKKDVSYDLNIDCVLPPNVNLTIIYYTESGFYSSITQPYNFNTIAINEPVDIKYIGLYAQNTSNDNITFNISNVSISDTLQNHNDAYSYSNFKESKDLKNIFKPKMLFMDYYMGRKINIHREDGDYVYPSGKIDKNKLHCYYFLENEYIEFSDYGTIDNQNNFLAYQDHFMLNRRILDQPNSWGKTQTPYNKYNKRITTINDYNKNGMWKGVSNTLGNNPDGNGFEFMNEQVTDLSTFSGNDLREDSMISKLRLSWDNTNNTYTLTDKITTAIIVFSVENIDYNTHNFTIQTTSLLGLKNGDLVKLDISDKLYYVKKEYISSNKNYLEVEGAPFLLPNYTGNITLVSINIVENSNIGDVINIISLIKDENIPLKLNDKLYLEINAGDLNIGSSSTIKQLNDVSYYIEFDIFNTTFKTEFHIDSTINDLLLKLRDIKSEAVQIATQILEKRCIPVGAPSFKIVENSTYNFITSKNIVDMIQVENLLYIVSADKYLFVVDNNTNILLNTIQLNTTPKYITHDNNSKKLYISGGDINNKTIDIIDTTIDITDITTVDVGYLTGKVVCNPINNLVYISTKTSNKVLIFIGNSQYSEINISSGNIKDIELIDNNPLLLGVISDNGHLYLYDNSNILVNDINLSDTSLIKILYDKNKIYITASQNVYVINISNLLVDTIFIPQGIVYDSGCEIIDIEGINTKKLLFITNGNDTNNTNITIIDRDTNSIINTLDCGINIKDIKYNNSEDEDLIYLASIDGIIKTIKPIYDAENMVINNEIEEYYTESGLINKIYHTINTVNNKGLIYLLKNYTSEISYVFSKLLEPSNININLNILSTDFTSVIREIKGNKITFWDLLSDEMVYELNSPNNILLVRNLNYFDGDLLTLKYNFDKHLLGKSYNMTINEDDYIYIDGSVNNTTKYYNLETNIKYATYGTNSTLSIDNIEVKYDENIIYGANYSILNFLKNLNPIFTNNYTFNLPNHTYTFQPLFRTAIGEFKEFNINKNVIYIGNDITNITDYIEGTFIDITNNYKIVNRVYIKSIEKTYYEAYPTKIRWVIKTDKALDTNLDLVGDVSLRSRNTLEEISMDLEFTDDLMFPITNGSNGVTLTNNTYYRNQVTSKAYSNLLLNDDNIRRNVSSVVHLDETNDWIISVINWKDDPNFFYRPLELFEVGVDYVLKKSITIDSSNYLVEGNTLQLKNVDFNKFNYQIVDGLTVKDFEEKFYWVLNADIRNAVVGQDKNGNFVWYSGDWIAGTFESGIWYSGIAYNMEWINGDVYSNIINNSYNILTPIDNNDSTNTIWYKSTWYNGVWHNGTTNDCTWEDGKFLNGVWNNGTFKNGTFFGSWNGGIWVNGTFLGGEFSQNNTFSIWENGTWLGGDFANGTWKNGIFDQTSTSLSRFGTKATLLNNAIWEYGWWKNGEFHSYLNVDEKNITQPSTNYKYSTWYNGTWENGIFFGGIWKMGIWKNGVFANGYLQSDLNINEYKIRNYSISSSIKEIEIVFDKPHYYKNLTVSNNTLLENHFIILGEPTIIDGNIHPNTELLGYNTSAGNHKIIEIVDDYTVLININDANYPYDITQGTSGYIENVPIIINSTSGNCCNDYSVFKPTTINSYNYNIDTFQYIGEPRIATHWKSGTFKMGVWDYAYWNSGLWQGGIWIDGVFENGIYGTT